jgi:hypothetical protein
MQCESDALCRKRMVMVPSQMINWPPHPIIGLHKHGGRTFEDAVKFAIEENGLQGMHVAGFVGKKIY